MPSSPLSLTVSPRARRSEGTGIYRYCFDKEEVLVGRDPATDVRLPHAAVSLVHLRLIRGARGWLAVDEASTNGTFLDGRRLLPGEPAPVAEGCRITAGPFELQLGAQQPDEGPTAPEDTAQLARQMVLEMLGALEVQQHPCLQVDNGPERGQQLQLHVGTARPLVIGRGESADLRLSDADASREHLELRLVPGAVLARDLGSKNGTVLNGRPLDGARPLRHGDVLEIGQTRLVFSDPAEHYLRDLQAAGDEDVVPGEQAPAPSAAPRAPGTGPPADVATAPGRRSEWLIWLVGAAVVLGAAGVILYLLL